MSLATTFMTFITPTQTMNSVQRVHLSTLIQTCVPYFLQCMPNRRHPLLPSLPLMLASLTVIRSVPHSPTDRIQNLSEIVDGEKAERRNISADAAL